MRTRDWLVSIAANWPSPHVRRFAPMIGIILDALDHGGYSWRLYRARQILIADKWVGCYQHPSRRSPRRRGCLVIRWRNAAQRMPVVKTFETLDDALKFYRRPQIV